MEDLLQVSEVTPVPKTAGAAKKAPKQPKTPKEPKVEAEIPQEVQNWKSRTETLTLEMTEYIQAAQKERETWLSNLTDSNPIGARLASSVGGKSAGATEIISDENVQLL